MQGLIVRIHQTRCLEFNAEIMCKALLIKSLQINLALNQQSTYTRIFCMECFPESWF